MLIYSRTRLFQELLSLLADSFTFFNQKGPFCPFYCTGCRLLADTDPKRKPYLDGFVRSWRFLRQSSSYRLSTARFSCIHERVRYNAGTMSTQYHQLLDATIRHLEQLKAHGVRFIAASPSALS